MFEFEILRNAGFSCSDRLNSMNLLMYMAPVCVVLLVPATIIMEDDALGVTVLKAAKDWRVLLLLLLNSTMAYFVNLTNFLVTKYTSPLTLQVSVADQDTILKHLN